MCELLLDFWKWSGLTEDEYAKHYKLHMLESDYPFFEDLLQYAKNSVSLVANDQELAEDVLTILALDNEAEELLEFLVDNLPFKTLNKFVVQGIHHLQPHARWQTAELAYRRKVQNRKKYFQQLLDDKDDYVRKRAKNLLFMEHCR